VVGEVFRITKEGQFVYIKWVAENRIAL